MTRPAFDEVANVSAHILLAMLVSMQEPDGTPIADAQLPAALGPAAAADSLPVVAASQGYASGMVTVTRPANTTAYTAGDVVGAAAAAITFPNMGPSGGGEFMFTSVAFEWDVTAVPSGATTFTLHLYSVTPPSALADNAAFDLPSGDRASYLGSIFLGAPVDLGSTLYVEQHGVNKQVTLASSNVFGYLVTTGAYTPASAAVYRIGLHGVAV